MPPVDTLVTRYTMDNQDYTRGADQVTGATSKVSTAVGSLKNAIAALGGAAIVSGLIAVTKALVTQGAEFEAQTKALSLYADEVNTTEKMLGRLKEVAKLPGLGNIEAIQGAVRLLAGGFDFTLAERSMLAFGNALAAAGGGKEELDGVLMALTQIAAKGAISAEEINQIAERVPQIREAMQGAFGTSNTEQLQKMGITAESFVLGVLSQLEKLPRAVSGMKNTLSNLGDFFGLAMAEIGMGINKHLIGALDEVGRFGEYLSGLDIFKGIGEGFGKLFFGGGSSGQSPLISAMAFLVAYLEELPRLLSGVFQVVQSGFLMIATEFTKIYNMVASLPGAKLLGMKEMNPTDLLITQPFNPLFQENRERVLNRQKEILGGYAGFEQKPFVGAEGGSLRSQGDSPKSELEKQTSYLDQIAKNTDPQRNSILGGGSLAAKGVTPTELSAMNGRDELSDLARALGRLVDKRAAQMAADMVQFNNPLIGGR